MAALFVLGLGILLDEQPELAAGAESASLIMIC